MSNNIISNTLYDRTLLWLIIGLISIGLIIITSASISLGLLSFHDPLYFAKRHLFYLIIIFILSLMILKIPMTFWLRYSIIMLFITCIMLLLSLLFGNSINGASRWISFGLFHIQPSELSKFSLFCYVSGYLERKVKKNNINIWEVYKPIGIMIFFSLLLLIQPDFGTVIILFITTISLLFLAGINILQFTLIISVGIGIMILLIIYEPYRINRILSFWDPWKNPFGSGYQLTQSFMALGRGSWLGQGLGNSIQKLEYLPEAHTDFIFSVLGEEIGYLGIICILLMMFFIAFRSIAIGYSALLINQRFSGFFSCSIGIWFFLQTLINVSSVIGILPTKGLTLPFMSYGGSSLFVISIAMMLVLRIDFETRLDKIQAF